MAESTPTAGATPAVTMYTTTWCGYCKRLKRMMQDDGINFVEVDIETTPGTAEIVEKVNNGNQTVPTLVFTDGTAMTNPSLAKVKEKLAALAG
ncbi:MAG: mycoredoxin [Ilumatobacteraceae bacterium]